MKLKSILLSLLLSLSLSAITIGQVPIHVTINDDNGGLVKDNSAWDSSSLKDKVLVMFYVDPDEKDLNNDFSAALKAQKYNRAKFGSIAIINLAASWKPNFAIENALKYKQEEFPHTLYVKDKNRVLVKQWNLADDNSDILIFSKNGQVIFHKDGKMQETDIKNALQLIKDNL
jgi:predicted transcriptional regulator